MRARTLLAAALVLAAVVSAGAMAAASRTQAAWTDRVYSSAAVVAGNWAPKNSCTATDMNGGAVACSVKRISFDGWGTFGSYTRGYTLTFDAPGAKLIDFSVDLRTAVDTDSNTPGFSWAKAGIGNNPPFIATGGWTCASLPILTAQTKPWQTSPYFQVHEDRSAQPVTCK